MSNGNPKPKTKKTSSTAADELKSLYGIDIADIKGEPSFESAFAEEKRGVALTEIVPIKVNFDQDIYKYAANPYNVDPREYEKNKKAMYYGQSNFDKVTVATGSFLDHLWGSFVTQMGITLDVPQTMRIWTGQEQDYSNKIMEWGHKWTERGQKGIQGIKRRSDDVIDFGDFGYWMTHYAQSGTSFGMAMGALLETAATSFLTAGMGTAFSVSKWGVKAAKYIPQLTKANKARGLKNISNAFNVLKYDKTQAVLWAGYRRNSESVMEAADTNRQLYEDFIDRGYTEKEAREYAAKGAAITYRMNMVYLPVDAASFMFLTAHPFGKSIGPFDKFFNKIPKIARLPIKTIGAMGEEFIEESYQHIAQSEAEYAVMKDAGLISPTSFGTRFNEYIRDPETINAGIAGAVGAILLGPAMSGYGRLMRSKQISKINQQQKEFYQKVLLGGQMGRIISTSHAATTGDAVAIHNETLSMANETALKAVVMDEIKDQNTNFESYVDQLEEMVKLAEQKDEVIDQAMINVGFTNEAGYTKENRIQMVKEGKSLNEQHVKNAYRVKELFEKNTKKYKSSEVVIQATATEFNLELSEQKLEELGGRVGEHVDKSTLTEGGQTLLKSVLELRQIQKQIDKIDKMLPLKKGKEKVKLEKTKKLYADILEAYKQEKEKLAKEPIVTNRTKKQRKADDKVFEQIEKNEDFAVAVEEKLKFELEVEQAKQDLKAINKKDFRKKEIYQSILDYIQTVDNTHELLEAEKIWTKENTLTKDLRNKIVQKLYILKQKELTETAKDEQNRMLKQEETREHYKSKEDAQFTEEQLDELENISKHQETKTTEEKTETPPDKTTLEEDPFSEVSFSLEADKYSQEQLQKFKDLVNSLYEEYSAELGSMDFVTFIKKLIQSQKNLTNAKGEVGALNRVESLFIPLQLGWQGNNYAKITPEQITTIVNGIFKQQDQKVNDKLSLLEEVANQKENEEKAEKEQKSTEEKPKSIEDKTEDELNKDAIEEVLYEINYVITPRFAYLSRNYELKLVEKEGKLSWIRVEKTDTENISEIVDSSSLQDASKFPVGTKLTLQIPKNFEEILITPRTEDGVKDVTKKAIPFKEFMQQVKTNLIKQGLKEGTEEFNKIYDQYYEDHVPILIIDNNGIARAFVHQTNWNGLFNLFPKTYDSGKIPSMTETENVEKAKQETRKIRKETIVANKENKAAKIQITSRTEGSPFILEKRIPLKEASLNQAILLVTDHNSNLTLPKGIELWQLGKETDLKGIKANQHYVLRPNGFFENGTPKYILEFNNVEKYSTNKEFADKALSSTFKAIEIFLLANNKELGSDAKSMFEVKQLEAFKREINKKYGIDLSTLKGLQTYLNYFFIPLHNKSYIKNIPPGTKGKTLAEQVQYAIEKNGALPNGMPFILANENGILFGISGQKVLPVGVEQHNYFFNKKNIKDLYKVLNEIKINFAEGFQNSLKHEKISPYIPVVHSQIKSEKSNFPLITYNEQTNTHTIEKVDNYSQFLIDNILHSNLLSINIGTKEKPVYTSTIHGIINYVLEDEYTEKTKDIKAKEIEKVEERKKEIENIEEKTEEQQAEPITMTEEVFEVMETAKELSKFFARTLDHDTSLETFSYIDKLPLSYQLSVIRFINNQLYDVIDTENLAQIDLQEVKNKIKNIVQEHIYNYKKVYENTKTDLEAIENPTQEILDLIEDFEQILEYFTLLEKEENYKILEQRALEIFIEKNKYLEVEDSVEIRDEEGNMRTREKSGLETIPKISSSVRIKRILGGVPVIDNTGKLVRGFLNLPEYMSVDHVFDVLHGLLNMRKTKPTIQSVIETLMEHTEKLPWLQTIVDRLQSSDTTLQTKKDFVTTLVKDVVNMEFYGYTYDSKTKTYHLKLYKTNFNDNVQNILRSWSTQFQNSSIIKVVGSEFFYDKNIVKIILDNIEKLQKVLKEEKIVKINGQVSSLLNSYLIETKQELQDGVVLKKLPEKIINQIHNQIVNISNKTYTATVSKNGNVTLKEIVLLENIEIQKLTKQIFKDIGIDLDPVALREFIEYGYINSQKKRISFENQFKPGGVFNVIANSLKKIQENKTEVLYDNLSSDNIFTNSELKFLAQTDAKYNFDKIVSSFRDNKKTIGSFTDIKYFTQIFNELVEEDDTKRNELKQTSFSMHSAYLRLLENEPLFREILQPHYLGITALKQIGKKHYRDNGIRKLAPVDLMLGLLVGFQDMKQGNMVTGHTLNGIDTRIATVQAPAMESKDATMLFRTLVLNLTTAHLTEDGFSENLRELMFSQLVMPELQRILDNLDNKTNTRNFDEGSKMFLNIPQLNEIVITSGGIEYTLIDYIHSKRDSFNMEEVRDLIIDKLEEMIQKEADSMVKMWKENGLHYIEEGRIYLKLDAKYLEKFKDKTIEEKLKLSALDFVINNKIAQANLLMMLGEDPAFYYEGKEGMSYVEKTVATSKNMAKRMAKLVAPRIVGENSVNENYLQIYVKDKNVISNTIKYKVELLDKKKITDKKLQSILEGLNSINKEVVDQTRNEIKSLYPNSANFFEIKSTDGQELTTIREHLHVLESMGREGQNIETTLKEVEEVKNLLDKGVPYGKLTAKQKKLFDKVFQPVKPVYTGQIFEKENKRMRSVYIKTSSFPLLPWITAGKELDILRVRLEEIEKAGKNVRVTFDSGSKAGGVETSITLFDENGRILLDNLNDVAIEGASLVLPRKYFGIQQDVPYNPNKENISLGTQLDKILMTGLNHIGEEYFKLKGKNVSGRELRTSYVEARHKLQKFLRDTLYDNLFIDPATGLITNNLEHFKALHKLLMEEANNRNWGPKAKEGLHINISVPITHIDGTVENITFNIKEIELLENKNFEELNKIDKFKDKNLEKIFINFDNINTKVNFLVPLWVNSNFQKIEPFLNSIISNKISKIKMPGSGLVLGTATGWSFTTLEGASHVSGDQIVYTDKYDGKGLKSSYVDNNGVFHPAQVLMPLKIKNNKGELINLLEDEKYYKIENGKKVLNTEMFSPEILEQISFRIPTSKLGSANSVEVVGFFPPTAGDLVIVPADFITQKGLDFDIDKEYVYQQPTYVTKEGKIITLKEKYKNTTVEEYQEQLLKDYEFLKHFDSSIEHLDMFGTHYQKQGYEKVVQEVEQEITKKGEIWNQIHLRYTDNADVTTQDLANIVKQELKNIEKDKENLLKADIIDLHQAVLQSTSKEVQEKISGTLSLESMRKEADYFENFAKRDDTYWSPLSVEYQIQRIMDVSASAMGVGAYSLDIVMQGLLTQASENGNTLSIQEIIEVEENGKIKKIVVPKTFNIFGIFSDGILGKTRTITGERTIEEILSERQNLMLDDGKEQIASRVGLNSTTILVDKVLTFLGYDMAESSTGKHSIAFTLFQQPIIQEYIKNLNKYNSASYTHKFISDKMGYVVQELFTKYNDSSIDSYSEYFKNNADILDNILSEMKHDELMNTLKNPDKKTQLAILKLFLELQNYGQKLLQIETNINLDTKGVGINLLETKLKLSKIAALNKNVFIENAEKIIGDYIPIATRERTLSPQEIESYMSKGYVRIVNTLIKPETISGFSAVYSLNVAMQLWGKYFPYNSRAFTSYLLEVLNNTNTYIESLELDDTGNNDGDMVSRKQLEIAQEAFESFQMYFFSDIKTGLFEENIEQQRNTLFFDSENNISLGSYLNKLKIWKKDENISKEVKYNIDRVLNNPLIKMLSVDTKNDFVTIQNSSVNNVFLDETELYNALILLYTENVELPSRNNIPYSSKKLVDDLVAYSYLEGGLQKATQMVKFIPLNLLKRKSFTGYLNTIHHEIVNNMFELDMVKDQDNSEFSQVALQHFQHFPQRAKRLEVSYITGLDINKKIKGKKIKDIDSFQLEGTEPGIPAKFADVYAVYNKDKSHKRMFDLFLYNPETMAYEKVPTYDVFGMNQYNNNDSQIHESIFDKKDKEKEYTKTLRETGVGEAGTHDMGRKGVIKTPNNTYTFDILESVSNDTYNVQSKRAATILENIMDKTDNPLYKQLASIFKEYYSLFQSVKIQIIDNFKEDGISAKVEAVFNTGTKTIMITKNVIENYSKEEIERVLLHEFFHSVLDSEIANKLDSNGNFKGKIENELDIALHRIGLLFKEAKKNLGDATKKDIKASEQLENRMVGALSNVREFVSEIMTSKEVQSRLNEVTYKDTNKSIFDKFKEIVTRFLNRLSTVLKITGYKKDSITQQSIGTILTAVEIKIEAAKKVKEGQTPAATPIGRVKTDIETMASKYHNDMNLEGILDISQTINAFKNYIDLEGKIPTQEQFRTFLRAVNLIKEEQKTEQFDEQKTLVLKGDALTLEENKSPKQVGNIITFKWNRPNSQRGTDADVAMREVATTSIVEIVDRNEKSSSLTTEKALSWDSNKSINGVVMLARNGKLKGVPLENATKKRIDEANERGAEFVVGDMPNVDSQYIEYLNEIGAKYTIYGHDRYKSTSLDFSLPTIKEETISSLETDTPIPTTLKKMSEELGITVLLNLGPYLNTAIKRLGKIQDAVSDRNDDNVREGIKEVYKTSGRLKKVNAPGKNFGFYYSYDIYKIAGNLDLEAKKIRKEKQGKAWIKPTPKKIKTTYIQGELSFSQQIIDYKEIDVFDLYTMLENEQTEKISKDFTNKREIISGVSVQIIDVDNKENLQKVVNTKIDTDVRLKEKIKNYQESFDTNKEIGNFQVGYKGNAKVYLGTAFDVALKTITNNKSIYFDAKEVGYHFQAARHRGVTLDMLRDLNRAINNPLAIFKHPEIDTKTQKPVFHEETIGILTDIKNLKGDNLAVYLDLRGEEARIKTVKPVNPNTNIMEFFNDFSKNKKDHKILNINNQKIIAELSKVQQKEIENYTTKEFLKMGTALKKSFPYFTDLYETYHKMADISDIKIVENLNKSVVGIVEINAFNALLKAQDTNNKEILYGHVGIYLTWFENSPIVQEGIKRFGSLENLTKKITDQVLIQEGEAYNIFEKFINWLFELLSDSQVLQILTDAFIQDVNLQLPESMTTDVSIVSFSQQVVEKAENKTPNSEILSKFEDLNLIYKIC